MTRILNPRPDAGAASMTHWRSGSQKSALGVTETSIDPQST